MNQSEEYSRAMREKRIAELEHHIIELEHQHKNDECANRMLLSWMKDVRSVKLHGDFEVRMVFTSCNAANAFVRSVKNERV